MLFLLWVAAVAARGAPLSRGDLALMRVAIISGFGLSPSFGKRCNACEEGHALGRLVRLAFHDAAGGPAGEGANGCIDLAAPANNGLEGVVAEYQSVYRPFQTKISIADFWVLGASVAIEMASTVPPGETPLIPAPMRPLVLSFRAGRIDRKTCAGLDGSSVPSVHAGWPQMVELFGARFKMTTNEIVAIMGAHSLGRITRQRTGFDGSWTGFSSSFSNVYFSGLSGLFWARFNASDVWTTLGSARPNVMLTSDVEMVYQPAAPCTVFALTPIANEGCIFNANPVRIVQEYALNMNSFYGNFSTAWLALTEFGMDLDLAGLLRSWGPCEKCAKGDFNCDEIIDVLDVAIMLDRKSSIF